MTAASPMDVQSGLATVAKYADGITRDWSLFVFFRILSPAEMRSTNAILEAVKKSNASPESMATLQINIANPNKLTEALSGAAKAAGTEAMAASDGDEPGEDGDDGDDGGPDGDLPFAAWLRLLTKADRVALARCFDAYFSWDRTDPGDNDGDNGPLPDFDINDDKEYIKDRLDEGQNDDDPMAMTRALDDVFEWLARRARAAIDGEISQRDVSAIIAFTEDHLGAIPIADARWLVAGGILQRLSLSAPRAGEREAELIFKTMVWVFDLAGKNLDGSSDPAALVDRLAARIGGADNPTELRRRVAMTVLELACGLVANAQDRAALDRLMLATREIAGRVFNGPLLPGQKDDRDPERNRQLAILALLEFATAIYRLMLASNGAVRFALAMFGSKDPAQAGRNALRGSLPLVCLYDLLRQMAPSTDRDDVAPLVRAVSPEDIGPGERQMAQDLPVDPAPITIAFTHSGLAAMNVDPRTLASFPAAFAEGMANRAARLGDTGVGSPDNWDGELGSKAIHGYFTTGFLVGDAAPEREWHAMREDIRCFNGWVGERGKLLRMALGYITRPLGFEVMHLELGQDPYGLAGVAGTHALDKTPKRLAYRTEHFGFRDGISQPFVDLGLGDPGAGGQTPYRDRSWQPVAPGEIFLGQPDEDGNTIADPANALLRDGGTYLVFRKLEQDVFGLRAFIGRIRATREGRERLAASFVGRWKNGMPLVLSPHEAGALGEGQDGQINDFLYAADDPHGRKCPLGAHVRRTNPRDIGGHGQVRRHRILRRGIGFGGPLVDADTVPDKSQRGLLFVAANSRIENQFEVIQADWINGGEFLGQAGLGRCPLTGSNDGSVWDSFFQPGAAGITHLPRFVVNRGGDYFFAPSLAALIEMALGNRFPPSVAQALAVGKATTPDLADKLRIATYVGRFLAGQDKIELQMPQIASEASYPHFHRPVDTEPLITDNVVFVGKYRHVREVLSDNSSPLQSDYRFSVKHYRRTSHRMTRGRHLLIGTETGPETGAVRQRLAHILARAWTDYVAAAGFAARFNAIVARNCDLALRRARTTGRIDLVADLATDCVYDIVASCYGVPGPDWVTELAIALPFGRQHVGQLHPDWLAAVRGETPANPRRATLQVWSIIILADLIGNVKSQAELEGLSSQASAEFIDHLRAVLTAARLQGGTIRTLVDAFVSIEGDMTSLFSYPSPEEYYFDVAAILLEMSAATLANIPAIFGQLTSTLVDNRFNLGMLIPLIDHTKPGDIHGIRRLIYETDRLAPAFGLFLRHTEADVTLGSGSATPLNIGLDKWVVALLYAANLDGTVFGLPTTFSLHPYLQGEPRNPRDYLLFGAAGGQRDCWGRDRLALALMEKLIRAVSKLDGLRRVPGPEGELKRIVNVPIGLKARVTRS